MKRITSCVAQSSLVDDLKSMGLYTHASVVESAVQASIKSVLEDEGVSDNEETDGDLDEETDTDVDDMEDILEDEGIESEEDEDRLPDDAIGLDSNLKYSPKQLKKLKSIAQQCLEKKTSIKPAKALLAAIAHYEASR
jgi:hypothetical protein